MQQTIQNPIVSSRRDAEMLARLAEKHRAILCTPIGCDDFLVQIAQQAASHQPLAKSIQAVYGRQVAFLSAVLQDYEGLREDQIKILDWGCGKGHISYLLQKHGFQVISCDIVSERDDSTFGQEVPIIQTKGIAVVPLSHPSKLPFEDGAFDCVVSFGVLEHVESDVDSLREIRRILKPGGLFFVTFLPYFLSWTQVVSRLRGDSYHDRLYSRRRLQGMAENAALHLVAAWHGQLFPKNSMPLAMDGALEVVDRFLCKYTPLKYFATNLEALLITS